MPTWSNTQQILLSLVGDETPVVIYSPSEVISQDVPIGTKYNGYITDLRLKSKINSLDETPLPEFALGDSKSKKLAVVRDLEYFSPHYHAGIFLRKTGGPWLSIFEFALHNRKPFFVTEILGYLTRNPAYGVAPDCEMGIGFADVGYGYPQGIDEMVLYGLVREEYSIPDPPIVIQQVLPTTPTEDISMADLTATVVPLTLGAEASYSADAFDQFGDGTSARLLAWPALKLAKLDFTLNVSYPPQESALLSWAAAYGAGTRRLMANAVLTDFSGLYAPNLWVEIRNNELVINSYYYAYSEEPYLQNSVNGKISGTITFSIP